MGTLDMFRVALMGSVGQQLVYGTPSHNRNSTKGQEMLAMAIQGGARSLGWADRIGSLEVGKRADVVLLKTVSADSAGYASSEAFLLECASGQDVHTVLVDGKVVVRDENILTVDSSKIHHLAAKRQIDLADHIS